MPTPFKLSPIALAVLAVHGGAAFAQGTPAPPPASAAVAEPARPEEPTETDPSVELPELTVEGAKPKPPEAAAAKVPMPVRDIPQSVSVVGRDLMEAQGVLTLRDALRNVAGLTLASGEGGFTGDSMTLRGFSARSDSYIDGVRDNGQYFRDSFNVERVEVLKGPSSMLFGRGATGGVLNSVTKKPSGERHYDSGLLAGSFDLQRLTLDVDQPVGADSGARLNVLYHDQASFRDHVDLTRHGAAPAVSTRLGERTRVDAQVLAQSEDSVLDYGIPFNSATGKPADVPHHQHYSAGEQSFQEYDVVTGTVAVSHGWSDTLKLRNTTGVGGYGRFYRFVRPGLVTTANPDSTTSVTRSHSLRRNEQQNAYNQTDVTWQVQALGFEHALLGGVELGHEVYEFRQRNGEALPNANLFDPDSTPVPSNLSTELGTPTSATETVASTQAVYVQDQVTLTPHWKAVAGVRFDHFEAELDDQVGTADLRGTDDMLSHRAGLVWQPGEIASYYASYGTAFNPSAETFSLSAATQDLDPEKSRNLEVGAKVDLFGGRAMLAGSVYRLEKTDARTTDPDDTTLQVLDGRQRTDGVELEIAGRVTSAWMLVAGIARMDAVVVESNTVNNGQPVQGKVPVNTPEWSGSVWSSYRFPAGLELGAGAFHVGERFADQGNTLSVDRYTRIDASAAYHWSRYRLALNGFNLADDEYFEYAHPAFATPGAPRSVLFSVGARF